MYNVRRRILIWPKFLLTLHKGYSMLAELPVPRSSRQFQFLPSFCFHRRRTAQDYVSTSLAGYASLQEDQGMIHKRRLLQKAIKSCCVLQLRIE